MFSIYDNSEILGNKYRTITGSSTGENAKFLRLWYEVSLTKVGFNLSATYNGFGYKWIPCNKGGSFRRWYGNQEYLINWDNDGEELKSFATMKNNGKHWSRFLKSLDCFYREGITWSKITSSKFSCRYMPEGFIMESAACAIMPSHKDIYLMLALMNTKVAQAVLQMKNPTLNMQTNDIMAVPIVDISKKRERLDYLVDESIIISKNDWDAFETSWNFKKHPLVSFVTNKISVAFEVWRKVCDERFNQLKSNEEEINSIFINLR